MRGQGNFTHRQTIRAFLAVIAVGLSSLLLGACGSSNSASTADPASVVPASAALYVQLNVPTSSQLSQFRSIVTTFGGASAWRKLSRSFNKLFDEDGLDGYHNSIAPWIGSDVGLAVTNLSVTSLENNSIDRDLVFILPTNNLKEAEATFTKAAKAGGSDGYTDTADGSFLLIGTAAGLKSFTSSSGSTLKSDSAYQAVESGTSGDSLLAYINAHAIGSTIVDLLSAKASEFSAGQVGGATSAAEMTTLESAFAKLPSDATLGLGVGTSAKTVRLDIVSHDLSTGGSSGSGGSGADVSSLPAGSILAAALNISSKDDSALMKEIDGAIEGELSTGIGSRLGASPAALEATVNRAIGALGPLQLTVSGSSLFSLKAGLTMQTPSAANATSVVNLLHSAIAKVHSAELGSVTPSADGFGVSLGPYTLDVSHVGAEAAALLGYTSASQLTSGSPLSSNATFKSAESQLPSGAHIPLFLNFEALAPLLKDFDTPSVQKVEAVVSKLSYLAVGSASGDTRIVLGLK